MTRATGGIAVAVVAAVAAAYGALQLGGTDSGTGGSGPQASLQALPPLPAPRDASGAAAAPAGWGRCVDGPEGYSISFPGGWMATAEGLEDACSLFKPGPFEVEPGAVPAAAMVVQQLSTSFADALSEVEASEGPAPERVEFFVLRAMRFEVVDQGDEVWPDGTKRYGYLFDRSGDGFVVQTVALPGEDADYEANRKVVDQAAATLEFVEIEFAEAPRPKRAAAARADKKKAPPPAVTVAAAEPGAPATSEPAASSGGSSSSEPSGSSGSSSSEPSGSGGSSPSSPPPSPPKPQATRVTFTDRSAGAGQFSDRARLEARLTDSGGDPVGGRKLTFRLASDESSRRFSATTDGDGVAAVTPVVEERPGAYRVTVRFAGSDRLKASSEKSGFTVEREDTATVLSVDGEGDARTLTARLSDLDTPGRALESRTVRFFGDGEFLGSDVTDADGVAVLQAPPGFRGGHHDFEARFDGDDFYLGSSGRAAT